MDVMLEVIRIIVLRGTRGLFLGFVVPVVCAPEVEWDAVKDDCGTWLATVLLEQRASESSVLNLPLS
jgi:hypothetical protein